MLSSSIILSPTPHGLSFPFISCCTLACCKCSPEPHISTYTYTHICIIHMSTDWILSANHLEFDQASWIFPSNNGLIWCLFMHESGAYLAKMDFNWVENQRGSKGESTSSWNRSRLWQLMEEEEETKHGHYIMLDDTQIKVMKGALVW